MNKFILQGYPATVDTIRHEAMLDVPPLLRRYVWSALLEIKGIDQLPRMTHRGLNAIFRAQSTDSQPYRLGHSG